MLDTLTLYFTERMTLHSSEMFLHHPEVDTWSEVSDLVLDNLETLIVKFEIGSRMNKKLMNHIWKLATKTQTKVTFKYSEVTSTMISQFIQAWANVSHLSTLNQFLLTQLSFD